MYISNEQVAGLVQSNYQLKTGELDRSHSRTVVSISALDLDTARVDSQPIPASKFGLELICGASCAVGAM